MGSTASIGHLVTRFLGSIKPGPPSLADEQWALEHLGAGEAAIWRQMSNPDRRHAVEVARAVVGELGERASRPVVAAALMHDSGKIVCGYRTPARVVATVVWAVVDSGKAAAWLEQPWPRRSLAQYRLHPELGAQQLRQAGADPLTAQWAADHHRSPADWTIPADLGSVLAECDGD